MKLAGLLVVTLALCVVRLAAQGGPYERQKIDAAAAKRGRTVYAQHCINCHGSAAKGTERGPDLIRSSTVLRDQAWVHEPSLTVEKALAERDAEVRAFVRYNVGSE